MSSEQLSQALCDAGAASSTPATSPLRRLDLSGSCAESDADGAILAEGPAVAESAPDGEGSAANQSAAQAPQVQDRPRALHPNDGRSVQHALTIPLR